MCPVSHPRGHPGDTEHGALSELPTNRSTGLMPGALLRENLVRCGGGRLASPLSPGIESQGRSGEVQPFDKLGSSYAREDPRASGSFSWGRFVPWL